MSDDHPLRGLSLLDDIARDIGVSLSTMYHCYKKEDGFPEPVASIGGMNLYDEYEVAIFVGKKPPGW